ncbi:glycoside hydrolase family 78 protein [Ruania alkalisoli]|uniref:alpha-L-rhamnosidase n=1 Tax=Ruania alkalisoli TaxID=2779775 RepID=A0A7M1SU50_9MICO|nr:glycoside hydrolase family 78 protein [Ruania alkalisoli]QOR71110.1 glycoside hydrolase family 78 protein [Ruania alkalisoli]
MTATPHPPLEGARMIGPARDVEGAPLLRTERALDTGHGRVTSATLTATGLGVFEAFVNGHPVGPDVLTPGWSSYQWRLRWRTWDLTHLLHQHNNDHDDGGPCVAIGATLGNGWHRGRLGFAGGRALYGDELAFMARLDVTFADGNVQTIVTDETWRAAPSATLADDLYDGQTIDARRHQPGWNTTGFDDTTWAGVHEVAFDPTTLTAPIGPPVVRHETIRPVQIWTSPTGKTLLDFGQNLVGWLRLEVSAPAGTEITVRHAEVLEHGELGTRPLRTAEATDRYITSGAQDVFEPTFTFHGFRYAEITGWPGELAEIADAVGAVVVGSDLKRTGHFSCSDPDLNRLHENLLWSLRGNFLDVPLDCPQRDERLGWTGDIAVFAPTAAYLYDTQDFLADWLADLAAEQQAQGGRVPFMVPDVIAIGPDHQFKEPSKGGAITAIWSDAAVWVPWALYQAHGDSAILQAQYSSMTAHVEAIERSLSPTGLWDTGWQFADWLDPDAPPNQPDRAKADRGVVATACAYRSADLQAQSAAVLGHGADETRFRALADRLRAAFHTHYVHPGGRIVSDCATVYALAIEFGLLDDQQRHHAGERLADLVAESGYRVSTGFAGTPYVTSALSSTGHLDAAYRLLLERECPSWLYPVTMGATTIWERWNSMLPDGSINPGNMTSFNHYALGAVAHWLHTVVAGISPAEPGYSRVRIAPRPGGNLTWAEASLLTPHGLVRSAWRLEGDHLILEATVPQGTSAVVDLPGAEATTLGPGTHHLRTPFSL